MLYYIYMYLFPFSASVISMSKIFETDYLSHPNAKYSIKYWIDHASQFSTSRYKYIGGRSFHDLKNGFVKRTWKIKGCICAVISHAYKFFQEINSFPGNNYQSFLRSINLTNKSHQHELKIKLKIKRLSDNTILYVKWFVHCI